MPKVISGGLETMRSERDAKSDSANPQNQNGPSCACDRDEGCHKAVVHFDVPPAEDERCSAPPKPLQRNSRVLGAVGASPLFAVPLV